MKVLEEVNNFKEYGFQADFVGEIVAKIDDTYIGYVVQENKEYCEIWSLEGISLYLRHDGWNLTKLEPIQITFTGGIQHYYERGDGIIVLPKDVDKSLIRYNKQYKITLEEIK